MTGRIALYYAPGIGDPLTSAAEGWLGYSAWRGIDVERHASIGLEPETLAAITEAPRRYGFHATLKPPMRLATGRTFAELEIAAEEFSADVSAVEIPGLVPQWIGAFLALVPAEDVPALADLAESVVRHFEPFRAPLTEAEMARWLDAGHSDRQQALLREFGYPYVLDQFRFHMTLTGPVEAAMRPMVETAARAHFAAFIDRPRAVDRLALFEEPEPGARFVIRGSIPLIATQTSARPTRAR